MTKELLEFLVDPNFVGRSSTATAYQGKVFKVSKGQTGIICGYKVARDFWVYWVELKMLAHYTHVQASDAVKGENKLAAGHPGVESYRIPEEYQPLFLNIAQEETRAVAKAKDALGIKTEEVHAEEQYAKDVASESIPTRPMVTLGIRPFQIEVPSLGIVQVFANSADEAWDVLRKQLIIREG